MSAVVENKIAAADGAAGACSVSVAEVELVDSAVDGPLAQAEALRLTDEIRHGLENVWQLAVRAWQGRVWVSLGYASWDDYCTVELDKCRVKLPTEASVRAAAWRPLVKAGMSQQAIASVAGVTRARVQQVLSSEEGPRGRVVSLDGASRPASRPTKADVLIRQARAAQLRDQGMKQGDIAAELGVGQPTVSMDLAQIDKMRAALADDIDVGEVLEQSRDDCGRTDAAVVARQLGVQTMPAKHLSRLVRQPVKDLEATLRVVVNEVVLADEWLDETERAGALEVLMPATIRVLEHVQQILAALTEADRCGEYWQAVIAAIGELERIGRRA